MKSIAMIANALNLLREGIHEGSQVRLDYVDDNIVMPLSIDTDRSLGMCFTVPTSFIGTATRFFADHATLLLEHPGGLVAMVYLYPELNGSNPLFDILWELSQELGEDLTMHCMPIAGYNGWQFVSKERIDTLCEHNDARQRARAERDRPNVIDFTRYRGAARN